MMAHGLELRDIKSHRLELTVRKQGALIIIYYL